MLEKASRRLLRRVGVVERARRWMTGILAGELAKRARILEPSMTSGFVVLVPS
jgi:hypothetical protein